MKKKKYTTTSKNLINNSNNNKSFFNSHYLKCCSKYHGVRLRRIRRIIGGRRRVCRLNRWGWIRSCRWGISRFCSLSEIVRRNPLSNKINRILLLRKMMSNRETQIWTNQEDRYQYFTQRNLRLSPMFVGQLLLISGMRLWGKRQWKNRRLKGTNLSSGRSWIVPIEILLGSRIENKGNFRLRKMQYNVRCQNAHSHHNFSPIKNPIQKDKNNFSNQMQHNLIIQSKNNLDLLCNNLDMSIKKVWWIWRLKMQPCIKAITPSEKRRNLFQCQKTICISVKKEWGPIDRSFWRKRSFIKMRIRIMKMCWKNEPRSRKNIKNDRSLKCWEVLSSVSMNKGRSFFRHRKCRWCRINFLEINRPLNIRNFDLYHLFFS